MIAAEPSLAVALVMVVVALGAYMASFALLHRAGRPRPHYTARPPDVVSSLLSSTRVRNRPRPPSPAWPRANAAPAAPWERTPC